MFGLRDATHRLYEGIPRPALLREHAAPFGERARIYICHEQILYVQVLTVNRTSGPSMDARHPGPPKPKAADGRAAGSNQVSRRIGVL
jgi:hypothetical protein